MPEVGPGVRFGAAYYLEYQPRPRLEADMDLMAAAGFTAIRVGESVWSTWEPEDGRFDLDWLEPVLDAAERVIRAVVSRDRDHPALIGYQVDNEPGLRLLHNHGIFERFIDWLRARYGTVARLNEAWGLVYRSHRLSTWDDLWRPDGNLQPRSVTAATSSTPGGDRVHVIHNWSWDLVSAPAPGPLQDPLSGEPVPNGAPVELGPWDVRVLAGGAAR